MEATEALVPDVNHFIVEQLHEGSLRVDATRFGDVGPRYVQGPLKIDVSLRLVGEPDFARLDDLIGRRVVLLVVPS